jgi:hypothetical protein
VAGHVGLELRNVVAKYPFERSHRFPGIQPNSGRRDYSRSSCDGGRRSSGLVPGSRQDACAGRTGIAAIFCRCRDDPAAAPGRLPAGRGGNVAFTLVRAALRARSREFLSPPNCAVEVLVHARRHGLVVLISNVFAHHLRVQEAVTANAAMPLVAGEHVRTPLGAFRVVFGIGHF